MKKLTEQELDDVRSVLNHAWATVESFADEDPTDLNESFTRGVEVFERLIREASKK